MQQLKSFEQVIAELSKLPGVGEKSAQRLAYFILRNKESYPDALANALFEVKNNIQTCDTCFAYTENTNICKICNNEHRSMRQICVVEEAFDIGKIEAFGKFHGKYHVLGGTLSPLQGIGPDQLNLSELQSRIESSEKNNQNIEEIILALDADLEGDTTALYIANMLEGKNIKISRLAHGIPFGTDIDYIDQRTLGRAFENRMEL